MILSGNEIAKQVRSGSITIEPFNENQINPNSYNYRLGELIQEVRPEISTQHIHLEENLITIPSEGLLLKPGHVYLGHTAEIIGSKEFVTSLIGRSSLGRLGLFLQISADLGNLGPAHRWTLELTPVQPIVVYPGMIVGQVSFWAPMGSISEYTGQYTNYSHPKNFIPQKKVEEFS